MVDFFFIFIWFVLSLIHVFIKNEHGHGTSFQEVSVYSIMPGKLYVSNPKVWEQTWSVANWILTSTLDHLSPKIIHRQWYVLLIKLSLHIFLSYFIWLSSQEYNLLWQQSHIWKKTDSIPRLFSHRLETRDTGHIETKKSYLSREETDFLYALRDHVTPSTSLVKLNWSWIDWDI
jgi:hypothetical protein